MAQPCPAFIPPDLFENKIIDSTVDSFAFGVLLYKCYTGNTVLDCSVYDAARVLSNEKGTQAGSRLDVDCFNSGKYISPSLLHRLPSEVRDHCKMLLSFKKELRPTPDQLRSISFFQSGILFIYLFIYLFVCLYKRV